MDAALLTQSIYLKSAEFQGKDVTLTIDRIVLEELEDNQGRQKTKGVIWFKETRKGWVLNRTNVQCMVAIFGKETDHWRAKRVTLFPAPFNDPMTKEPGTAIRVRGSPEISAPIKVDIKLPRKKPFTMTMVPTGVQARPKPPQQQQAPQLPEEPPMPTEPM